ncbi:MAG TPA: Gfo/Idh/MocA family oxidoreductase [Acidimicrobiales bacterium]|nr:Gfo/Idh/MocA family oxidoreductase [Acidimicrobiales bacterium]
MTKPVRVGAIGAGYWGPNLIRNLVELPEAEMVAVGDLNEANLTRITTRYPSIKHAVKDYRELFDMGLDAVVIATPPETHYPISRDCMEAGLDILIEKPLTTNSLEARAMIRLAEHLGRVLMVGHTFEYNPAVWALKKMIDNGELGELHYIDAVRVGLGLFHPSMNVIWDLGPHDVSILIHLLDARPHTVSARGIGCVQKDVEDIVYMTLMFPGDTLAHVRLSWLDPSKTRRITVVGNKKMAIYDDVESIEKIRVYDKGVDATRRTDTFGEFQFAYRYGSIVSPYIRLEEPVRLECQHFIECVRDRRKPKTDGYSGLRVIEVIEAAQLSLKSNGVPVPVEYLPKIDLVQVNGDAHRGAETNGHEHDVDSSESDEEALQYR